MVKSDRGGSIESNIKFKGLKVFDIWKVFSKCAVVQRSKMKFSLKIMFI
jgi:hypothetical protein